MTYRPTHQFCPKCGAMLPPHLADCPRCEQSLLETGVDLGGKDILRITGVVLLIAAVPFVLLLLTTVICVASAR